MGLLTFLGGIHPYEGKELSMEKPVREYLPKGDCVYPLSQHIGAPATPIVKKGDRVLVGQKIAETSGFVSANIHSSISGKVKAIEPRYVPGGSKVESIVVENDGLFEEIDFAANVKDLSTLYREDVKEIIKEAGIVGMGGAGFPANVKLSPKNEDAIDYIIVNGAECEPYLTSDYRRMMEEPDKLILGLEICINLFDHAKGIIAIEDNKPKAIELLRDKVKDNDKIEVHVMKTKYPQGAERQLIYANTGRYVNSKMLPADAGCIVHNVDTIVSIYDAPHNSTTFRNLRDTEMALSKVLEIASKLAGKDKVLTVEEYKKILEDSPEDPILPIVADSTFTVGELDLICPDLYKRKFTDKFWVADSIEALGDSFNIEIPEQYREKSALVSTSPINAKGFVVDSILEYPYSETHKLYVAPLKSKF